MPEEQVKVVRTDLNSLPKDSDCIVWFGHSSYLLQLAGKRILVDPVFDKAAPLSSVFSKTFPGADVYQASDMPEIDWLVITHDHYDHLSRKDVQQLLPRVGHIGAPRFFRGRSTQTLHDSINIGLYLYVLQNCCTFASSYMEV